MNNNQKPIIPVYLNQRIVFDLLAMLEGGLCQVTKIASSEEKNEHDEKRYGAEFGLNKALSSLLSINVSGDRLSKSDLGESIKKDEERVHTPASLFYRLRNQLLDTDMLKILDNKSEPNEFDLVEFEANMVRNPLIQAMDSLISIIDLARSFSVPEITNKKNQKRKDKNEFDELKQTMITFTDNLKNGVTVDMLADDITGIHKAIVTLEIEYLNDPNMADLVDGRFKVVGKVIRNVEEGHSISFIRKSALTIMPSNIINDLMENLSQLSDEHGFNLPKLDTELPGPAFQLIPIAIFAQNK